MFITGLSKPAHEKSNKSDGGDNDDDGDDYDYDDYDYDDDDRGSITLLGNCYQYS